MQPSKSVGDTTSKGEIGSSCSESSLLSWAAIKLQDTFAEQETEETETDNAIILDQEIQQIEVEIDVPTKESKDDSEQEEPISPANW
jgi:hypothetical protein